MDEHLGIITKGEGIRDVGARTSYLHAMMVGSGIIPPAPPVSRDVELGILLSPTTLRSHSQIGMQRTPPWLRYTLKGGAILIGAGMLAGAIGLLSSATTVGVRAEGAGSSANYLIGGLVLGALALTLLRLTLRPLMQFALMFAGSAFALISADLILLAVLLDNVDARIDPSRAAVLGVLTPLIGISIAGIAFARWFFNPTSRARWAEVSRWASIAYAGWLLLLCTAILMSVYVGDSAADLTSHQLAAFTGVAIPLAIIPATTLALHGWKIHTFNSSSVARFPSAFTLLLAFVGVIALGGIILLSGTLGWAMLPLHALAALLPATFVIAWAMNGRLAGRSGSARLTNRQVWLALALGIAVVTTLAGTIDSVVALAMSLAAYLADGTLDRVREANASFAIQDPDMYLSRTTTMILVLSVVSFMVPFMEEGFKATGLALVLPKNATRATAFALGAVVGAGFGITEASLYGLYGLNENAEITWWLLLTLRGGATCMHALNTGLVGLALVSRNTTQILKYYLVAVALHGLWNGLAVLAGTRIIFSLQGLTDRELALLSFAVLSLLTMANLFLFSQILRRLHAEPLPAEGFSELQNEKLAA